MRRLDIVRLNVLAELIRKNGAITKGTLWKNCNLSISTFEKLKPYIVRTYEDIIYDRKKQMFICRTKFLSLFIQETER